MGVNILNEVWYLLATTKRSVTCGQCCEIFIRLQSVCRAINILKTQFQFFKFVFLAQITERNGHSLTWKDRLSTESICCSDSRVTNFSYSSNNGPSNSKWFYTFFTSSTRYLSWDVGVCLCVCCGFPLHHCLVQRRFLHSQTPGQNKDTTNTISITQHV